MLLVNLLFINYGDFSTNSIHHIAAFANELTRRGNQCLIATPDTHTKPDLNAPPLFGYGSYEEILLGSIQFENRKPADIVHAWTPRENVRQFVEQYLETRNSKLVAHLEDNEEALMESFYHCSFDTLKTQGLPQGFDDWEPMLSHPRNYKSFLEQSHGITVIIDTLLDFAPQKLPSLELWPGLENCMPPDESNDSELKAKLGIEAEHKTIVYCGGITSANLDDVLSLCHAVGLLNESGHKVKLIKTGPSAKAFENAIPQSIRDHVIDLGIIPKTDLPRLLSISDALVQPGRPNAYNDYRLPSKLPEFLLSGSPVIATASNLALRIEKEDTLLGLEEGTPEEICTLCKRLFESPELSLRLSANGRAFAESHFSLEDNTEKLLVFYRSILADSNPSGATPKEVKSPIARFFSKLLGT